MELNPVRAYVDHGMSPYREIKRPKISLKTAIEFLAIWVVVLSCWNHTSSELICWSCGLRKWWKARLESAWTDACLSAERLGTKSRCSYTLIYMFSGVRMVLWAPNLFCTTPPHARKFSTDSKINFRSGTPFRRGIS